MEKIEINEKQRREDGAYVFHHPPKFLWEKEDLPLMKWTDFTLYVHVPFCREICTFCTFERKKLEKGALNKFMGSILKEIEITLAKWDFSESKPGALYLGGGTASLLSVSDLTILVNKLRSSFGLLKDAEITLECEPGTKQLSDFRQLKSIGINRVSIGFQAFQNELLRSLNRMHTIEESLKMFNSVKEAGIENIHIDLMFGLPGQTMEDWKFSIQEALKLAPKHFSLYTLIVFKNELLDRSLANGTMKQLPSTEVINEMREWAQIQLTENGYDQYSLTEYCKSGYQCRYVTSNWNGSDYLGFGPAAYSRNGSYLWENHVLHTLYHSSVKADELPYHKMFKMNSTDICKRDLAMGVCLLQIPLDPILTKVGEIDPLIKEHLAELENEGLISMNDRAITLNTASQRFATYIMKRIIGDN
ncbi:MAG: coproporphyrinogen oxidase, anaerobic [Bacteroidetes bacterium]|nr:coproporphyrinogen oxidase, anaerobic [Bacteroidota bacterium]